jgi:calcineurin-like phosphoesterase family protein
MNETIIQNWNRCVSPNDTVYHLGDFCFAKTSQQIDEVGKRLNGKKILIAGNHDNPHLLRQTSCFDQIKYGFYEFGTKHDNDDLFFVLCHYAMRVWNKSHYGSIHLYGHSHGTLPELNDSLSCDVGVDSWNFTPVSMTDILQKMSQKTFVKVERK